MYIEVPANSLLRGLDTFLRDTWVECCGHLSAFSIHGIRFLCETDEYFKEDKSMNYLLEKLLMPGMEFSYEYDFGSPTSLDLKVVSEREVEDSGRSIEILARNELPVVNCDSCGKIATYVCRHCGYSGKGWVCDDCASDHECGEEVLLHVVNSPRVGVFGYIGGLSMKKFVASHLHINSCEDLDKAEKKNRDSMKKAFNFLAIVLLVFLIGFFLEETIDSSILSNYQTLEDTFEIISELFSVFVALSIFAITWNAYNKSRDNHSLFLGTTFLITGILILFHLLSYPFMPDFITSNSSHKAGIFFLESRYILAFFLLASVFVNKDSCPKLITKKIMVLLTAAILSFSLASVLLYHDFLMIGDNFDSYSTGTVLLLFLITITILFTCYLYNKRAKETFQINLDYLANGSILVLISNLVYFSYEFSGHFLIITGFFYFYLGLYKSSIDLPYEMLAISEEKLRIAAQEKYRRLFDKANDAIVTIDTLGGVTSWNKSAEKLFGLTVEEITGKKLVEEIASPETMVQKEKMIFELISDTITGQETTCVRRDGTKINVSVTVSPLLDVNGNVLERSLIFRDITERKRIEELIRNSLQEKEVLLREIHHRVKNNMQIVSSLLMLQSQNIDDKKYKDIFIESQTRIHSMALIHEKLYQSENIAHINFKEYIDGVVSNIFESYCIKKNIKIEITIENIPVNIDSAVPCGLIINELVTNSLKYAFPEERPGKIQISLKSNYNNMFQLSISDDGIGIAKDMDIRNTKSLGLHLVTALVEGQLHGEIILNRESGTEFQINFGNTK